MMVNKKLSIGVMVLLTLLFSMPSQAGKQMIAGAGPSTKVVELFVKHFSKQPAVRHYQFMVPPRSVKHAGGIKASSTYVFGRTGRPLNAREKAMNKSEIVLARIPIAFATGEDAGVSSLTLEQVVALYQGKIRRWSEVGGSDSPVVLVGRESTEALFGVLKKVSPAFEKAKFDKVLKKDHQVVTLLKHAEGRGAIGFGAHPNFSDLNRLQVEGFSAGVAVGLVYDLKNQDHPLVHSAQSYVQTVQWHSAVRELGLLPPAP